MILFKLNKLEKFYKIRNYLKKKIPVFNKKSRQLILINNLFQPKSTLIAKPPDSIKKEIDKVMEEIF